VLREYLDDFVVAYLDDILNYSTTLQEHTKHVRKVLSKLLTARNRNPTKRGQGTIHRTTMGQGPWSWMPQKGKLSLTRQNETSREINATSAGKLAIGLENAAGPRHLNATNGSPESVGGMPTQQVSASDPRHPDHGMMSWTACTEDSCWTHKSEKGGAGWYPKATQRKERTRVSNQSKN